MRITMMFIGLMSMLALAACTGQTDPGTDGTGIGSFEECEAAGGSIGESYPRQCFLEGSSYTEELDEPQGIKEECEAEGGTWIGDAEECEGISEGSCEEMGGRFNECASACRNDPDAVVCTMQCVFVCEFGEPESVVETFNIGPELKECVGVGPQQCMVVDGKFFYDHIKGFEYEEGFEYTVRVEKTERENPPADAGAFEYSLLEIVSKEPVSSVHVCTDEEIQQKACTKEFNPVCGDDGKDYSNPCMACGSGMIDSWTEGSC